MCVDLSHYLQLLYLCIGLLAFICKPSKFEVPDVCISAEILPPCFSSHMINKYLLHGLFSTILHCCAVF